MEYESIFLVVTKLFFGLIILWFTSLIMINKKKIIQFLPFFILGITSIFPVGFALFGFFFQPALLTFDLLIFFLLTWIFINLWRKNGINY